jgi:hypothetical protein
LLAYILHTRNVPIFSIAIVTAILPFVIAVLTGVAKTTTA